MAKFDDLQPSEQLILDLESFARTLRDALLDDGCKVVAYGPRSDAPGAKVLTIWDEEAGAEEYAYPEVLGEVTEWLNTLPTEPPDDD